MSKIFIPRGGSQTFVGTYSPADTFYQTFLAAGTKANSLRFSVDLSTSGDLPVSDYILNVQIAAVTADGKIGNALYTTDVVIKAVVGEGTASGAGPFRDVSLDLQNLSVTPGQRYVILLNGAAGQQISYGVNSGDPSGTSVYGDGKAGFLLNSEATAGTLLDSLDAFENSSDLAFTMVFDNIPPVVVNTATSVSFAENQLALVIDPDVTIADENSSAFSIARVQITGGFQPAEDKLLFTPDKAKYGDLVASGSNGTLLLSVESGGSATMAQWQAALQSVSYTNVSDRPSTAQRTVTFSIYDDEEAVGSGTRTITVTGSNDAPVTAAGTETGFGDEDTVLTGQLLAGKDPDGDPLTYNLISGPQGLLLSKSGEWTWTPPTDFAGSSTFSYNVNDGKTSSASKSVSLTVRAVDEVPGDTFQYNYDGMYFAKSGVLSGAIDGQTPGPIYVGLGASATLDYDIGLGLVLRANLPTIEHELTYDIDLEETVSTAEVTLNEASWIDTSDWKHTGGSFSTSGFDPADLKIAVDLVGKLKAKLDASVNFRAGIEVDFGEIDLGFYTIDLGGISERFSSSFSTTILNVNTSGSLRLFTLGADNLSYSRTFAIAGSNEGASITAALPEAIELSTEEIVKDEDGYGNFEMGDVSGNDMLNVNIDVDDVVSGLLRIPNQLFGGSIGTSAGPFSGSLSYEVVDADLNAGLKLEQRHKFTAEDVSVVFKVDFPDSAATNNQDLQSYESQSVTGKLGDKFTFETPQGEGEFTVTGVYTLNGTITTKTGLFGSISFDYKILEAILGASIDIDFGLAQLDKEIATLKIGPRLEDSEPIAHGSLFTLFTQTDDIALELFTRTYTVSYENFYIGTEQDDTFTLTRRQVSVNGEGGNDKITGNVLANVIDAGGGNDVVLGLKGDDQLSGGSGNDVLDGGEDDDFIKGNDDNDLLTGGQGVNSLDGGLGIDMASYRLASSAVVASLASGTADWGSIVAGTAFGKDTLSEIEELEGTAFADDLEGSNVANTLIGLDGSDSLRGLGGDDTLLGGRGGDTLNGGSGSDLASYRSAEASVIASLTTMTGTAGDAAGDRFISIEGLEGSAFADQLTGGKLDDLLSGLDGNDQLSGQAGNDLITGGAGADALDGGTGFDIASYRNAQSGIVASLTSGGSAGDALGDTFLAVEALEGSAFDDTLVTGTGQNKLWGLGGNDRLYAGESNDEVFGGAGDDWLYGEGGSDVLDGGSGMDVLVGGLGNDVLSGGAGADRFVFSSDFGYDTITDFTVGSDRLALTGISIKSLTYRDVDKNGVDDAIITFSGSSSGTVTLLNVGNGLQSNQLTEAPAPLAMTQFDQAQTSHLQFTYAIYL